MIYIDKYAYVSKLKNQDPIYKLVFCLMTLGVCLWANSIVVSLIILLIMAWYTIYKGGIPIAVFSKLMAIPLTFLLIGSISVGIDISDTQNAFLYYIKIFNTNIGISTKGAQNALYLFFKVIGAASCMYYLTLNTPMVDLLQALGKLRIPKLFIELMGLIYRFIFVLLETVDMIFIAQKSRMGYSGISSGYRSLAALASTLFLRAYKRTDSLYTALEARGYEGEINVLDRHFETTNLMYAIPIAVNMTLVLICLILRYFNEGVSL